MVESRIVPPPQAPEIAGVLREPFKQRLGDAHQVTYHWETQDGRNTFLHLTLRGDPNRNLATANVNLDSEEISGQGNALWRFMDERLQFFSNTGIPELGLGPRPIIHHLHVNDFSRRLPEEDPRYIAVDGKSDEYFGLYLPSAE